MFIRDTRVEGVREMHEAHQVRARECETDESIDVTEDGGVLETPLLRAEFVAGAGKLGIRALGLSAFTGFAPAALGTARSSRSTLAKSQVIAMIENASGPFYTDNFEKPMRAYLA